jgi:hypothetical protein
MNLSCYTDLINKIIIITITITITITIIIVIIIINKDVTIND